MSFLRKLFGFYDKEIIKRFPRLSTLNKIGFMPDDNKRTIPAINISFTGIGLDAKKSPIFQESQQVPGQLILDGERHPMSLSIRHVTPKIIGCSFIGPSETIRMPIENYLKYELAGVSMRKISTEFMNADPRGDSLWFTDGKANEIYVLHRNQDLIMCHLTFFGNYFEVAPQKPVRVGFISDVKKEKAFHKGSDLVRYISHIDQKMLEVAERFLFNIEGIPGALKEQIKDLLLSTLTPKVSGG